MDCKYRVRIDPLTESGSFDVAFFASNDYKVESKILLKYLKNEGFDEKKGVYTIFILERWWEISVSA